MVHHQPLISLMHMLAPASLHCDLTTRFSLFDERLQTLLPVSSDHRSPHLKLASRGPHPIRAGAAMVHHQPLISSMYMLAPASLHCDLTTSNNTFQPV